MASCAWAGASDASSGRAVTTAPRSAGSGEKPGSRRRQSVPARPEVPIDGEPRRSSAAPFAGFIAAELGKRRNATAIFQDLVEHHGYDGSYDAIKRLARKLRKAEPKIACRYESEPGEEMQVDYGEGALTRDRRTGKYRRPRLFVLTLGNSRNAFRATVWKSSSQTWCELHERPSRTSVVLRAPFDLTASKKA